MDRNLDHLDAEQSQKTVYVETIFWRNCDPLLTVAGFDRAAVIEQARKLADDEIENAIDDEIAAESEDGDITEDEARDNLASDLCSTGLHEFTYTDVVRNILDAEHVHELDTEGITIL